MMQVSDIPLPPERTQRRADLSEIRSGRDLRLSPHADHDPRLIGPLSGFLHRANQATSLRLPLADDPLAIERGPRHDARVSARSESAMLLLVITNVKCVCFQALSVEQLRRAVATARTPSTV